MRSDIGNLQGCPYRICAIINKVEILGLKIMKRCRKNIFNKLGLSWDKLKSS